MKVINEIKALRHKMWQGFWKKMPLQQNKVILWSDNFKSFGCSPKYIALYLAEHYPGKFDVVWVLEQGRPVPEGMPEGIRMVRYFSMQYLKEIATAKVIVCNHRTGDAHYFKKRKGQFYIQTWHGGLALKKIEADAPGLPESYVCDAKKDSQKIDLMISGWKFTTNVFRNAFWYSGEVQESGTPRCDCLFGDPQRVKEKVYRFYNIPADKKFVLYAPTFRKDKDASCYGMDFGKLLETLGENFVAGCRLHPNIQTKPKADHCILMGDYPDMQELLIACDLLITDYSSSMFDMAIVGKKCALFTPDLEAYLQNERGMYFDISALPFPRGNNMAQLCNALRDWDGYSRKVEEFLKEAGCFENGNAAQAVAERIERVCYG